MNEIEARREEACSVELIGYNWVDEFGSCWMCSLDCFLNYFVSERDGGDAGGDDLAPSAMPCHRPGKRGQRSCEARGSSECCGSSTNSAASLSITHCDDDVSKAIRFGLKYNRVILTFLAALPNRHTCRKTQSRPTFSFPSP